MHKWTRLARTRTKAQSCQDNFPREDEPVKPRGYDKNKSFKSKEERKIYISMMVKRVVTCESLSVMTF